MPHSPAAIPLPDVWFETVEKEEADGRRIREVGEPRLYATGHASAQPFLSPLDETEWRPAHRLAPYRPRRKREAEGVQERLFREEQEASGS
jgi:hypothetical protein